jgi:hypothetical protein
MGRDGLGFVPKADGSYENVSYVGHVIKMKVGALHALFSAAPGRFVLSRTENGEEL